MFTDKPEKCKVGKQCVRLVHGAKLGKGRTYKVPIALREETDKQMKCLLL